MGKFNTQKPQAHTETVNRAGGAAFDMTNREKLVALVMTSFLKDQFYRSGDEALTDLQGYLSIDKPEFNAKLALYARNIGMRSVTHVIAGELAPLIGGNPWAKRFFDKVVYRVDDMMEIFSYTGHMTNAMKKGFAQAIGRFDGYQLAKYKQTDKKVSLIDIVNLVHPSPNGKNADALKALVAGELKQHGTWEDKVSKAGSDAKAKTQAWDTLLSEDKLGYLALIRNIRNMGDAGVNLHKIAQAITNVEAIHKSKIFPFQLITAMRSGNFPVQINDALSKAMDTALENIPSLDGSVAILVDGSGSMQFTSNQVNGIPVDAAAALYASAIWSRNPQSDVVVYSANAEIVRMHTGSLSGQAEYLIGRMPFMGTNLPAAFAQLKKKYDYVIILSDEQSWMPNHWGSNESSQLAYDDYCHRTKSNPMVYSFDLCGYGTTQLKQSKIYLIPGISAKVFDFIKKTGQGMQALINEVEAIEL